MSVAVYPPHPEDASATILVAEDDEPIRLAVREVLEVEGYQVTVAVDGAEALDIIARDLPSLVITDLQMPNLDGRQLCTRLRSDMRTEQVPIVVLTADHRIDNLPARVDAVIRKPFDIDVLLSTVAQFIRPTLLPRPAAAPPSVRLTLRPKKPSFTLYITDGSSASERAERTVRRVLDSHHMTIEVVHIQRDPERAAADGVAMTPMLIRTDPRSREREAFLGDLSEPMLVEEFVTGA